MAYVDGNDITTWDIAASKPLTMDQPGPPKRRESSPLSNRKDQISFDKNSDFIIAPDGRSAIYQICPENKADGSGIYSCNYSLAWWDFNLRQAQKIESDGFPLKASFAPSGRRVAISQYQVPTVFDVTKRTPLAAYPRAINHTVLSGRTSGFSLSPEGHTVVVINTDTPNVIPLTDTDSYQGIPVDAKMVAVQSDKKHLTTVTFGDKVAIYSIENRNLAPIVVRSSAGNQSNKKRVDIDSLSPNGLYYAFTDDRAQKVRLLDISSPLTPNAPLEGNDSSALQISFDPRSDFLACANESEIIIWSTKDRTKTASIPLPKTASIPLPKTASIRLSWGHTTDELKGLAISPGGRYVAATNYGGETRLWDTHSNDHTGTTIPFDDANLISFSPDGNWLSIGDQNEIKLWILGANKFGSQRIPVGGSLMNFSPDSTRLAIRDPESGHISVWNFNGRDPLLEGTVSQGSDFAFTSDNSNLVVNEGGVFVERFDASWALEHVCHIVKRNLTPVERDKYLSGFDHVQACPSQTF